MRYANPRFADLAGDWIDADFIDGANLVPVRFRAQVSLGAYDSIKADNLTIAPYTPTAADIRATSIRNDTGRIDLLNRLRTSTPAQIDTWVDSTVTNIAGARTALKAIIKAIALDVRT